MADGNQEFSAQDQEQLAAEAKRLDERLARLDRIDEEELATTDSPRDAFCTQIWPVLRPIFDFVLKVPGVPENVKDGIRKLNRFLPRFCERAGNGQ